MALNLYAIEIISIRFQSVIRFFISFKAYTRYIIIPDRFIILCNNVSIFNGIACSFISLNIYKTDTSSNSYHCGSVRVFEKPYKEIILIIYIELQNTHIYVCVCRKHTRGEFYYRKGQNFSFKKSIFSSSFSFFLHIQKLSPLLFLERENCGKDQVAMDTCFFTRRRK